MPRTLQNLWPEVTAFPHLWAAWQAAASGKRQSSDVMAFEIDAETRVLDLQRRLLDQSYRPGPYRSFLIHDPKRRWVSAAPFVDRVLHHALVRAMEPGFEASFIAQSYANRIGKGTHDAVRYAQACVRQYRHVLQCDLRQFFPSVDHQVLFQILAKKINCTPTLQLVQHVLASGDGLLHDEYDMVYFPGDDLLANTRPRGLPIGNLTSQFWANVLMNEVDQFVKRQLRCKPYLRYVDDFLLFGDDKKTLWAHKAALHDQLSQLRLTLHERSSTVYPCSNGVGFLGMRIFPTHIRLKTRNARAFEARFRQWQVAYAQGTMTLEDISRRVQGWVAHAQHADTVGLRQALFEKPWTLPE